MKKLLFSLLLAFPAIFVSAQSITEKVGIGINGGLSIFNLSGVEDAKSKTGFTAGVSAALPLSGNFYLQPELNYQQQGAKGEETYQGVLVHEKINLGYLNVPVLAKYKFAPTHLSVYVGPQIGFLLSAKGKVEGSSEGISYNASESIKDQFKTVDFGGVYGLEYYFPVTPTSSIVLNARYQTGFTNIAKGLEAGDPKVKNKGFTFTVGYRF